MSKVSQTLTTVQMKYTMKLLSEQQKQQVLAGDVSPAAVHRRATLED